MKKIVTFVFLAAVFTTISCKNPFLQSMLEGENASPGFHTPIPSPGGAPFVEGGASLILSPDKRTIWVNAITSDGTSVMVEGCIETELQSNRETYLHAKGTKVVLKGSGNIISLNCGNRGVSPARNKLVALNVQGLRNLQRLECALTQLSSLNVQRLSALQWLDCGWNQLTALNVQGLNALQWLHCGGNRLTTLNVQGLNSLQELWCYHNNQLTALDVQGCSALKELYCSYNRLTALNVQGLTSLRRIECETNQLTADAFKKLFTDLPVRVDSDYTHCTLYGTLSHIEQQTGVTEGNHTDFSTPSDLAAAFNNAKHNKKWTMYKRLRVGGLVEI